MAAIGEPILLAMLGEDWPATSLWVGTGLAVWWVGVTVAGLPAVTEKMSPIPPTAPSMHQELLVGWLLGKKYALLN